MKETKEETFERVLDNYKEAMFDLEGAYGQKMALKNIENWRRRYKDAEARKA